MKMVLPNVKQYRRGASAGVSQKGVAAGRASAELRAERIAAAQGHPNSGPGSQSSSRSDDGPRASS
jgi:hypothetical protein